MPPTDAEIQDRNGRSSQDDADIKSDVRIALYRLGELDRKFDTVLAKIEGNYATKQELGNLEKKVDGLNSNISWLVKTILGVVVVAILGLVIMKGGGPIR